MTRFQLLLALALLALTSLGLGVLWLWRQRGPRHRSLLRKATIVVVCLGCLLVLPLTGALFRGLWLERPMPVTADDLRILEKADALLKSELAWNRADDRECGDDKAAGKWSLFCALEAACVEVLGENDHRRAALQEVRVVVEEATRGREFEHRLMDQQPTGNAFRRHQAGAPDGGATSGRSLSHRSRDAARRAAGRAP